MKITTDNTDFLNRINNEHVVDRDLENYINREADNKPNELKKLLTSIEDFEANFISGEVVESLFGNGTVYHPKNISDRVLRLKELITERLQNKIEVDIPGDSGEISFKDMFSDPRDCEKVVELLKENNYVSIVNGLINWTPPANGNLTPQKYLTAIYFILKEKGYIKNEYTQTKITQALSNYFNLKLSNSAFSKNKVAKDFQEVKDNYLFISNIVK